MTDDSLIRMSPTEIAWGYPFGHLGELPPPTDPHADPRRALERVVHHALQRPPCGVAFSGGRDSSAVLAVATHVARRDGLPEPVPVTLDFPGVAEASERAWQEDVVRHLQLSDWEHVVVDDQLDLLGPIATARLAEHGVVWPPTIHRDEMLTPLVRGGSLLDGEGGDEVLGVAAHRVAPVTHLLHVPRPLSRRRLRRALKALAPGPIRTRRAAAQMWEQEVTWLRAGAADRLVDELVRSERMAPLSFARSVRRVPRRRSQLIMRHNRCMLARRHDVTLTSPLLDPDVVHALARSGGLWGPGDRTAALRELVPDLLPDAVLRRISKAQFGGAFWSRHAAEFVRTWRGDGLDDELVDPEELVRLWRDGAHNALSAALLQAAWLGSSRPRGRTA